MVFSTFHDCARMETLGIDEEREMRNLRKFVLPDEPFLRPTNSVHVAPGLNTCTVALCPGCGRGVGFHDAVNRYGNEPHAHCK